MEKGETSKNTIFFLTIALVVILGYYGFVLDDDGGEGGGAPGASI